MVPVCIRNQWSMTLGLLVGSGLWACLSAQAEAHAGSRVFPVPELTDEMLEQIQLHDGSVEEWFDRIGEPTMTLQDFAVEGGGEAHAIRRISTSASGWPGTMSRLASMWPSWPPMTITGMTTPTMWTIGLSLQQTICCPVGTVVTTVLPSESTEITAAVPRLKEYSQLKDS